jgi:protoheme IX farnesyltransferase
MILSYNSSHQVRKIIQLTKPGIIMGNLIPAIAGFFLGSNGIIDVKLLYMVLGTALVIASGCIFNNYIDRDIDALMNRTKNRILATKEFSGTLALAFGIIIGIGGFGVLYYESNHLSAYLGAIGWFFYVVLYSLYAKLRTVFSVHIGSISGAIPALIGYTSFTNNIDTPAILFFLLMVIWQMPHSFALSIFNAEDYARSGVPTVFSKKGIRYVRISMLVYIVLLTLINLSLTYVSHLGVFHTLNALILGLYWIHLSIKGFHAHDIVKWSKKMFFTSIIIITLSCVSISIG